MKLADYLRDAEVKDEDFAVQIGCDRSTVSRIRRGQLPTYALMKRIALATGGKVRPDDYFEGLPKADIPA